MDSGELERWQERWERRRRSWVRGEGVMGEGAGWEAESLVRGGVCGKEGSVGASRLGVIIQSRGVEEVRVVSEMSRLWVRVLEMRRLSSSARRRGEELGSV